MFIEHMFKFAQTEKKILIRTSVRYIMVSQMILMWEVKYLSGLIIGANVTNNTTKPEELLHDESEHPYKFALPKNNKNTLPFPAIVKCNTFIMIYTKATDFEGLLQNVLETQYNNGVQLADEKNKALEKQAEAMRLSILGKDSKTRDDKPLGVVEAYLKENTTEIVDPLGAEKRMADLREKKETLLSELETQIKVSNATTLIEF